jgi:hypothetical protein
VPPNMPLQRTRAPRFARCGSPLNGQQLGRGASFEPGRHIVDPAAEGQRGGRVTVSEHAPDAPRVPDPSPRISGSGGAPAGQMRASMSPLPNMPLQRTRSRALLGRSPLNGGSLGGRED